MGVFFFFGGWHSKRRMIPLKKRGEKCMFGRCNFSEAISRSGRSNNVVGAKDPCTLESSGYYENIHRALRYDYMNPRKSYC